MSKRLSSVLWLAAAPLIFQAECGESDPNPQATDEVIQQVYEGALTVSQAQVACRCQLEVVRLGGSVFHFGLDLSQTPPVSYPFQSTVPGTLVWIAEVPAMRKLRVRSDADGKWGLRVIKLKGTPLPISFVYELAGYVTTKSQVFEVGDAAIADLAVQFPSEAYFSLAKAQVESVGQTVRPGQAGPKGMGDAMSS
jgi:hypothetical protein